MHEHLAGVADARDIDDFHRAVPGGAEGGSRAGGGKDAIGSECSGEGHAVGFDGGAIQVELVATDDVLPNRRAIGVDAAADVLDAVPAGNQPVLDVGHDAAALRQSGNLPLPLEPAVCGWGGMGVGEGQGIAALDDVVVLVVELPAGAGKHGANGVRPERVAGDGAGVAGRKLADIPIRRRGRANAIHRAGDCKRRVGDGVALKAQFVDHLVGGDLCVGQLAVVEADAVDVAGEHIAVVLAGPHAEECLGSGGAPGRIPAALQRRAVGDRGGRRIGCVAHRDGVDLRPRRGCK